MLDFPLTRVADRGVWSKGERRRRILARKNVLGRPVGFGITKVSVRVIQDDI